jgi:hypothetical protein
MTLGRYYLNPLPLSWIRNGFNSMQILIQLFISLLIRIQGAKPMRIHADPGPDSDPGQTFKSEKIEFYKKNPHSHKSPDPDTGQPNLCGSGFGSCSDLQGRKI